MTSMNFKTKILNTERSRSRLSGHRRFITLTTHVSIVFAMSLAGTLATGYFFVNYVSGDKIRFGQLLQGDLLFPLIAIAVAITLAAGTLVMFSLRHEKDEETPPITPEVHHTPPGENLYPILKLHRHAERLGAIERSLMVRMSHSEAVDLNTRSILAEMQMCTKRLLGDIAEMERANQEAPAESDEREREPAVP